MLLVFRLLRERPPTFLSFNVLSGQINKSVVRTSDVPKGATSDSLYQGQSRTTSPINTYYSFSMIETMSDSGSSITIIDDDAQMHFPASRTTTPEQHASLSPGQLVLLECADGIERVVRIQSLDCQSRPSVYMYIERRGLHFHIFKGTLEDCARVTAIEETDSRLAEYACRGRECQRFAEAHFVKYHGPAWGPVSSLSRGLGNCVLDIDEDIILSGPSAAGDQSNDGPRREIKVCLTESNYALVSPVLYGYAPRSKRHLRMNIDYMSLMVWPKNKMDCVVFEQERKNELHALITGFSARRLQSDGQKILTLGLHGCAGSGKTSMMEAIAAELRCVPVSFSIAQLAADASPFKDLTEAFAMAAGCTTIIHLDDCDDILQKRDLIQYLIFKKAFDDFLQSFSGIVIIESRAPLIDVCCHYHVYFKNFTTQERTRIWKKHKAFYKLTPEELRTIATIEMNGHQIRNLVETANLYATGYRRMPEFMDFIRLSQGCGLSKGAFD